MREVKVDKTELLATIRENREKHRDHFERALAGWQAKVTAELEKATEDAKAGRKYRTVLNLPQPEDHTEDYDDIIGMLVLHVEDTIVLEVREYRRYVTDDWDWKEHFTRTASTYAAG